MKKIGILEDNIELRQTIEDFFSAAGQYKISFSCGSFKDISSLKRIDDPDFILLDIHLSDVLGIDVIKQLKTAFPSAFIIVITGDKEKDLILKALENGASAYLYKPFKMAELEDVIMKVDATGSFLEPEVLTQLLSMLSHKNLKASFSDQHELTPREEEIIDLLKTGRTYKEMAQILNVSFHTVNYHLKNIYIKTNVRSKAELMAKYFNDNK